MKKQLGKKVEKKKLIKKLGKSVEKKLGKKVEKKVGKKNCQKKLGKTSLTKS